MSLPIPMRLLLATQTKLATPMLQLVRRVVTRHLLGQSGLKADEAGSCGSRHRCSRSNRESAQRGALDQSGG